MQRALWVVIASIAIIGVSGLVQGSLIESTIISTAPAYECYQNDGPRDDGKECDVADRCQDASRGIGTTDGGRTPGQLVPVDDEHDYYLVHVGDYVGSRVRFSLAPFAFDPVFEMLTTACTGLASSAATSAPAAPASATTEPVRYQAFSGLRPFRPINVGSLALDGVATSSFSGNTSVATLDFTVINTPKYLTFNGSAVALDVAQHVRLCDYQGHLFASLDPQGALKFDGVASSYQVANDSAGIIACASQQKPVDPMPACGASYCEITVTKELTTLVLGIHLKAMHPPTTLAVPASCHDGCLALADPIPVPGEYDLGFLLLNSR